MLEYFADFPTQTLSIYTEQLAYDPTTGSMTRAWVKGDDLTAWVYTSRVAEEIVKGKVWDDVEFVAISEVAPTKESLIKYKDMWFTVVVDDVLEAGEVIVIGLVRADKPEVIDESLLPEIKQPYILGDYEGIFGDDNENED